MCIHSMDTNQMIMNKLIVANCAHMIIMPGLLPWGSVAGSIVASPALLLLLHYRADFCSFNIRASIHSILRSIVWDQVFARGPTPHSQNQKESKSYIIYSKNSTLSIRGFNQRLLINRLTFSVPTRIFVAVLNCISALIMSKPRAAKRKKSYASDDADDEEASNSLLGNLDLGNKSVTPKIVANALLSLLPSDATKQHASAKKLVSCVSYCIIL